MDLLLEQYMSDGRTLLGLFFCEAEVRLLLYLWSLVIQLLAVPLRLV